MHDSVYIDGQQTKVVCDGTVLKLDFVVRDRSSLLKRRCTHMAALLQSQKL